MITKSALLLFREANGNKELLFVKPFGKSYYIFPGGKQEPGETAEQALVRELHEELQVDAENIHPLGIVSGETPDGRPLEMHLFTASIIGNPEPSTEIEETIWLNQSSAMQQPERMTPMTRDHVFPFLTERKLW